MTSELMEQLTAPRGRPGAWYIAWLETVLFTIAAGLLALWLHPEDPLFVKSEFPWLALMPIVLALRYGAVAGTVSMALVVITWLAGTQHGMMDGEFPRYYFIGGEMLVLICGQFCSLWSIRLRRLERIAAYNEERVNQLTRRYYLARLSQDQLEQSLISKPVTLRSALADIRGIIAANQGELPGVADFMGLLSQTCQLEFAAIYPVRGDEPETVPCAKVGEPGPLRTDDPMLRECLSRRTLMHVREAGDEGIAESAYLVAAPLLDSEGSLLAVLVVEDMPFHALAEEGLRMMSVMLGYYADASRRIAAAVVIQEMLPGCPLPFAEETLRSHRLFMEEKVPSTLVAFRFDAHPDRELFVSTIVKSVRDLDCIWELEGATRPVVMVLLPLAGRAGVEGFLMRTEGLLRQRHNLGLDAAGITPYVAALTAERPAITMTLLLEYCNA